MSTTAVNAVADAAFDRHIPFAVVRDTFEIVRWRNLIAYRRVPQLLVFSTIQPVVFVVMFRYVFGGAIEPGLPPGVPYVDYLMPGIFVQTVVFGAIATAIGLATEHEERPDGAVPRAADGEIGRPVQAVRWPTWYATCFVIALMMIVGFLVGWRIHADVWGMLAGIGVAVRVLAVVDLRDGGPRGRRPRDRPGRVVPILAPLVFASVAFVPLETVPRGSSRSRSTSQCRSPLPRSEPSRSADQRPVT